MPLTIPIAAVICWSGLVGVGVAVAVGGIGGGRLDVGRVAPFLFGFRRLRAALLGVTELAAATASNLGPVGRLGTLTGEMADLRTCQPLA